MAGLILIPTELERAMLEPMISSDATEQGWTIETCGFGPIASAAISAALIQRCSPQHVLLIGIAGAFDEQAEVGKAMIFDRVWCYGIGVGVGDQHCSNFALGFPQCQRDGVTISDMIELAVHEDASGRIADSRNLLTTPFASADASEAAQKLRAFPWAAAEDMEGFAVATSCELAGVPLTIIRGISNRVGDRDHAHWQVEPALQDAAKLAIELVIGRAN